MYAALTQKGESTESPMAADRHYTPAEVAALWSLDVGTIRRIFQDEPGVLVLQGPVKRGRRPYKTIRIQQSVLERVHKGLQR